jgi:hypothetical protein
MTLRKWTFNARSIDHGVAFVDVDFFCEHSDGNDHLQLCEKTEQIGVVASVLAIAQVPTHTGPSEAHRDNVISSPGSWCVQCF